MRQDFKRGIGMQLRLLGAFAVCLPVLASAPAAQAHGLDIEAKWAPEVSESADAGAIYLRITNSA